MTWSAAAVPNLKIFSPVDGAVARKFTNEKFFPE